MKSLSYTDNGVLWCSSHMVPPATATTSGYKSSGNTSIAVPPHDDVTHLQSHIEWIYIFYGLWHWSKLNAFEWYLSREERRRRSLNFTFPWFCCMVFFNMFLCAPLVCLRFLCMLKNNMGTLVWLAYYGQMATCLLVISLFFFVWCDSRNVPLWFVKVPNYIWIRIRKVRVNLIWLIILL